MMGEPGGEGVGESSITMGFDLDAGGRTWTGEGSRLGRLEDDEVEGWDESWVDKEGGSFRLKKEEI